MFIECKYRETIVAINLDTVTTIAESDRVYDRTAFTFWANGERHLEVDETYESVMAKVRAAE